MLISRLIKVPLNVSKRTRLRDTSSLVRICGATPLWPYIYITILLDPMQLFHYYSQDISLIDKLVIGVFSLFRPHMHMRH